MGGVNGRQFRNEFPEILAPSRGNNLHILGDKGFNVTPTSDAKIVVGREDRGQKTVMIVFPKVGYGFAITKASELRKWRDAFDAMLDQIARPGVEQL